MRPGRFRYQNVRRLSGISARLQMILSTLIRVPIVSLATLRRTGDAADVSLVGFSKMDVVALP